MAVRRLEQFFAYGVGDSLLPMAPLPIIAKRDPGTNDLAQLGTVWCNEVTGAVFMLSSISSNSANWATSAVSGNISALSVTITAGDLTIDAGAGGIDVGAGSFTVDNSGNVLIGGNLNVAGTLTFTGDLDLTSAALIDLTSTLDAAPSILLHADGGTSEQILLHSDQGTSVSSVELLSDVGGITLRATGLASADAINLEAPVGGIDMDSALLMSLTSSRNNAQAILIEATAGGIDILASSASAGEDIDIVATGSSVNVSSTENAAQAIYLHANGGVLETVQLHADQGTAVNSINILSDVGGLTLRAAGLASADAINLEAAAGGLDVNAALQINIDSAQAAADAIRVLASDVAGGIDIDCGTGGIAVDSTGAFSIDGAAASNVTVTGAGVDLTLASVLGSVLVSSTEDAALAIRLHANGGVSETIQLHSDQGTGVGSINLLSDVGGLTFRATGLASADAINLEAPAGGIDVDAALQINVNSAQAAADALRLVASNAAGGIDVDAGTAGIAMDSTGAISLQGAAASDFSVSGAAIDLSLVSAAGSVIINGGEAAADALRLVSAAGGMDVNAALQINIDSSQAAADALRFIASNAAGGIDIDSGTAGIAMDSTGAISLQGAAASDFSVSGAAIDLSLVSAAGSVIVNGGEAAADAVRIVSAAGGLDVDAALQINIASSQNAADSIVINSSAGGIDILASAAGAGEDIDLIATGSSINLTSTEAVADAIVLNASNAAGGINLSTGGGAVAIASSGNVSMAPGSATVASPTASATINARVFKATYTGFTTASAASQDFTIANSTFQVGDGVVVTLANAGTNDAQMSVTRVNVHTAGSIVVTAKNNGAAALNGNVVITGWVID